MSGLSTEAYLEQADLIVDQVDGEAMSLDLQSLVATYRKAVNDEDTRKMTAFARAVVKRTASEGLTPATELTVNELKAEIRTRNEGRDEAAKIKPASQKKDDLVAALAADDDAAGG